MAEPELGLGPIDALVEWLAGDSDLVAALGNDADRIFGYQLPLEEADTMPRTCVVVGPAGGFAEGLPEVLDRVRVDARSYGRTHDEAFRVAQLVRFRMKALRRFVSSFGVVLHAPTRNGGYIPLTEQAGGWPLVLRSYLQPFDERVAA